MSSRGREGGRGRRGRERRRNSVEHADVRFKRKWWYLWINRTHKKENKCTHSSSIKAASVAERELRKETRTQQNGQTHQHQDDQEKNKTWKYKDTNKNTNQQNPKITPKEIR